MNYSFHLIHSRRLSCSGNLNFRRFAETYKERYKQAPKVYKPVVAAEVVAAWRNQNPPGRFLARTDSSTSDSLWYDVGDDHAIKRATKTLGERSQRERRAHKTNKMKMGCDQEQRSTSAPSSPRSMYSMSDDEILSSQSCNTLPDLTTHGSQSQSQFVPLPIRANDAPWERLEFDISRDALVDAAQQRTQAKSHHSGNRVAQFHDGDGRASGRVSEFPLKAVLFDASALQGRNVQNSGASLRMPHFLPSQQRAEATSVALWNDPFEETTDTSSSRGNDAMPAVSDTNSIWRSNKLSAPPNEDNNDVGYLDFSSLPGAGLVGASVPTAAYLAQCAFDDEDDMIGKKNKKEEW
jgi:hypothetical protein